MCEIIFFLARNQSKQAHTEKPILSGPGGAALLLLGYLRPAQRPRCVSQAARLAKVPPGPDQGSGPPPQEKEWVSICSAPSTQAYKSPTQARHTGRPQENASLGKVGVFRGDGPGAGSVPQRPGTGFLIQSNHFSLLVKYSSLCFIILY